MAVGVYDHGADGDDLPGGSGRGGAAQDLGKAFTVPAPAAGATAVQQSQDQNQMRGASVAPAAPTAAPRGAAGIPYAGSTQPQVAPVQFVGDKTFLFRNNVWTDTQFDPSKMTTKKIEFNSDAYFTLAQNSGLSRYMALGSRVIVVLNGVAYEITDDGSGAKSSSAVPASPTPIPTTQSRAPVPTAAAPTGPAATSTLPGGVPNASAFIGPGLVVVGLAGTVIAVMAVMAKR